MDFLLIIILMFILCCAYDQRFWIVLTSCINFTVLNLDLIPMLTAAFINPWFLNFHWAAHSFISDPKVSNTFTKLKNKNIFASGFKNWRTSTTGFFSCWSLQKNIFRFVKFFSRWRLLHNVLLKRCVECLN